MGRTVTGLTYGYFNDVSCTGSGANAVCVAVGNIYYGDNYIATSTDGGNHWTGHIVDGPTGDSSLLLVKCSKSKSNTTSCVAAGRNYPNYSPYFVVSTGSGKNWTTKFMANAPQVCNVFAIDAVNN
jgi:hypothetical protein